MSVIYNLFLLIVSWGLITGAYVVSRHYILDTRLKDETPATSIEKIVTYIAGIAICLIVCALLWYKGDHVSMTKGTAMFIAVSTSSILGMVRAYGIDKKLTVEQKKDRRFNKWKDRNKGTDIDGII